MLIGEYIHSIDDKKRISLPSKFRQEVGKKLVATYGLENCLFLYPLKEWAKISEEIGKLGMLKSDTREFNRFMFGGAVEVEVDSWDAYFFQNISESLRKLKTKRYLLEYINE